MSEILDPEMIFMEAQVAYEAGFYLRAANCYISAESGFKSQGNLLRAAEMANNCSVAFLRAGKAQKALRVLDNCDHIFIETGDIQRQAIVLGNRAAALAAINQVQEAINTYQRAADLFNSIHEHMLYTTTMQALSTLQLRVGRSIDAVMSMQAGLITIPKPNVKHRILKRLLNLPFGLMNRKRF